MANAESAVIFTVDARLSATLMFTRAASLALVWPVALALGLVKLEPEDGAVTPDGDMLEEPGDAELGLVELGLVELGDVELELGDVVLGDRELGLLELGDVALDAAASLPVDGVAGGAGDGAAGSLPLPFDVVVVALPFFVVSVGERLSGRFFDVSLWVLDCPVLG